MCSVLVWGFYGYLLMKFLLGVVVPSWKQTKYFQKEHERFVQDRRAQHYRDLTPWGGPYDEWPQRDGIEVRD